MSTTRYKIRLWEYDGEASAANAVTFDSFEEAEARFNDLRVSEGMPCVEFIKERIANGCIIGDEVLNVRQFASVFDAMTVHRDYANKSCPGDYLYNRHGEIAAEVNRRLGVPVVEQKPEQKPQGDAKNLYRVQLGAFEKKDNATAFAAKLKKEGFDTYIVQIGKYYKVQVGAFSVKKNAEAMLEKLKKAGHDDAFITYSGTSGGTSARKITTGSKVRVKAGAKTYSGGSLASFVYSRDHIVKELSGKRAVITYGGTVVAAVNVDDLTLV